MKKFSTILVLLFVSTIVLAQDFNRYFIDATLRIDYTFIGNIKQQHIAVDELCKIPRWYGKHQRLSELPVEGNGQITVRDHKTQTIIYRNSFSTLFQEWLSYDEAKTATKSFENVFLVPFPKDTADITIELRDNRRSVMTQLTHMVVPNDILIRKIGDKSVTPYETLQQAADTSRCIHIAYVAEGYTEAEMPTFLNDCRTAMEALFAHEPFKTLRNRFNVVAVKAPSAESGTSNPGKGIWKNTALHSNFNTFYSDRYLTTLHLKDLHNWLAGTPYEHIIVLVNTDNYGGGGILNSYNLSMTHHRAFKPVVVHEFGHSFAGLADEYAYDYEAIPMFPHDIEPWEKNITTMVDFKSKWSDMVKKGTKIPTEQPADLDKPNAKKEKWQIGAYEPAGYSMHGVYRAYPDCRMRTNNNPEFCPVCQKAITELVKFYTE
ncbi:igA Peptidase M64 [Prevotella disiens JCM 6334 = ATCC 29426]|uniref:IgA Peptidase M64 n=2 Tax=Prevotella disiens TaxID=28130 RepID=A0A379EFE6_9BACT|nr:M64 family metallopeptidase [Prevotella disiens]ERJ70998.1 igA Peptidase M64 [Prevotella disiens JCM 6334 = ATCC 29426]SUB97604.1 IgA Peptidase M64 [Prevotella disiens]